MNARDILLIGDINDNSVLHSTLTDSKVFSERIEICSPKMLKLDGIDQLTAVVVCPSYDGSVFPDILSAGYSKDKIYLFNEFDPVVSKKGLEFAQSNSGNTIYLPFPLDTGFGSACEIYKALLTMQVDFINSRTHWRLDSFVPVSTLNWLPCFDVGTLINEALTHVINGQIGDYRPTCPPIKTDVVIKYCSSGELNKDSRNIECDQMLTAYINGLEADYSVFLMEDIIEAHCPYKCKQVNSLYCDASNDSSYPEIASKHASRDYSERTLVSRLGTPLNYKSMGRGKIVVLINTIGSSDNIWDKLIWQISDSCRVLWWTPRGIEESDYPNSSFIFDIGEQCEDLYEILKAENVYDAVFVAWCSGVKTAVRFNAIYHNICRVQILLSSRYQLTIDGNVDAMICIYKDIVQSPRLLSTYFRYIKEMISEAPGKGIYGKPPNNYLEDVFWGLQQPDCFMNFLKSVKSIYEYDIYDDAMNSEVKTAIVGGTLDQIVSFRDIEVGYEIMKNAVLFKIVGGTHYLPFESAQHIAKIIKSYL